MRDFELDPAARRSSRPGRDAVVPELDARRTTTAGRSVVPGRSSALDVASLMHLQRTAGNAGVVQMLAGQEDEETSPVHDVVGASGGMPLDAATRSTMEGAFGTSFDGVRVHTDERASRSAESVGANAYTVGSDVVFRSGQFDPGSAAGQRTIAHELAHVVQQQQGPVDGTEAAGGIRVSDPSDRFERAAEQTADHVMASVQSTRAPSAQGSASATPSVAQLEEDEAAAPAVQRLSEDEEEEEQAPS